MMLDNDGVSQQSHLQKLSIQTFNKYNAMYLHVRSYTVSSYVSYVPIQFSHYNLQYKATNCWQANLIAVIS